MQKYVTLEERGGYPKCHQISHGVGWGGGLAKISRDNIHW
jgi:hypothetical protein